MHAPTPPEWEPLRRADEEAWARGLPNALDVPSAEPLPGGLPPLAIGRE